MQIDGHEQKDIPSMNDQPRQLSCQHQQSQIYGNQHQQLQPHFSPCYTCGIYSHLSKNCPQQAVAQQNVPRYLRSTPPPATPLYVNRPNTPLSILPLAFLLNNSPRQSQQLYYRLTQLIHIFGMKSLIK